jgi:hypothetical protein
MYCRRPTALPPQILPAERRGIPHHLLDVLEPLSEFSAGDFFSRARTAADDVLQVGRWGVRVWGGGSGVLMEGYRDSRRVVRLSVLDKGSAPQPAACCQWTCLAAQPCPLVLHLPGSRCAARAGAHRGRRHRILPALVCAGKAEHAGCNPRLGGRRRCAPGAGASRSTALNPF